MAPVPAPVPTAAVYLTHPSYLAAQFQVAEREAALRAAPLPFNVRAAAEKALRDLPRTAGVEIAWNHPDIGNHLGGVWLDRHEVLMLNERRLDSERDRLVSVVKHEVGHVYQGRIITANAEASGGWMAAYWQMDAALRPVFGKAWMERSADCIALRLGADWTHYTKDCDSDAAQRAVDALIDGRMP